MGGDPAARGERGARARGGRAAARGAGALAALPRGVLALAPAPPGQAARHRAPYAASGPNTRSVHTSYNKCLYSLYRGDRE